MQWNPDASFPEGFFQVARSVYRNDPNWLPEQLPYFQYAFSRGNSYFQDGSAWLAFNPGTARLAGFFNPAVRVEGKPVAFFGYWETADEPAPNRELFEAYEAWARQKGALVSYGPINFTTYNSYRIRLNRFEDGCFVGEPYNPPYYQGLLEGLGYRLRYRYMSAIGDYAQASKAVTVFSGKFHEQCAAAGIRYEKFTPEFWLANSEKLYKFIDVIFTDNFAYAKISYDVFQKTLMPSMLKRFCRHASVIAFGPDEEIAGFFLNFPDYSPLLRQGAAKPVSPFELSFEQHFPLLENRVLLAKTVGVMPQYRHIGLFSTLSDEVMRRGAEYYRWLMLVNYREDNFTRRTAFYTFKNLEEIERVYGLYMKEL